MPRSPRISVQAKYISRRLKRAGSALSSFDLIASEAAPAADASLGSSAEEDGSSPPPSVHLYNRGSRYRCKPKVTAVAVLLAADERRVEEEASSPPAREAKQWDFIRALDAYSLDLEADRETVSNYV